MTLRFNKMLTLLLGVYFLIFLQSHWQMPRLWLGFQPDLTPALMVFVGLTMGAGYVSSIALMSGLWLDSLSANPFGMSILPLFLVGWIVFCFRKKIMAVEFMAQIYLGILGGLLVFLLQLTLLMLFSFNPLIGWEMIFLAMLNAFFCGVAVPFFYLLHKWFKSLFSHSSHEPNKWRNNNRQIVRGKSY
jgi:hypothetical protein